MTNLETHILYEMWQSTGPGLAATLQTKQPAVWKLVRGLAGALSLEESTVYVCLLTLLSSVLRGVKVRQQWRRASHFWDKS